MSGDLNDDELIRGLKQGNEASSQQFVKIYGPCLRSFIRKNFGLSYADIDEIVQAAFYKVVRNIQKYRASRGAQFSTWVFGITVNIVRDWLRKVAKQPDFVPYGEDISEQIPRSANDEKLSEAGLLAREALSSLDPVDKEILERHLHGVALVDIAKTLAMEEGTVRQRKFRALEKLKGIIENLSRERGITLGKGRG